MASGQRSAAISRNLYFWILPLAVVESFPLTASGKIQKYKLREMAAERWPEAMR